MRGIRVLNTLGPPFTTSSAKLLTKLPYQKSRYGYAGVSLDLLSDLVSPPNDQISITVTQTNDSCVASCLSQLLEHHDIDFATNFHTITLPRLSAGIRYSAPTAYFNYVLFSSQTQSLKWNLDVVLDSGGLVAYLMLFCGAVAMMYCSTLQLQFFPGLAPLLKQSSPKSQLSWGLVFAYLITSLYNNNAVSIFMEKSMEQSTSKLRSFQDALTCFKEGECVLLTSHSSASVIGFIQTAMGRKALTSPPSWLRVEPELRPYETFATRSLTQVRAASTLALGHMYRAHGSQMQRVVTLHLAETRQNKAFIINPLSPYRKWLDVGISKLRETGILAKIVSRYLELTDHSTTHSDTAQKLHILLGPNVNFITLNWLCGTVVAILAFVGEKMAKHEPHIRKLSYKLRNNW